MTEPSTSATPFRGLLTRVARLVPGWGSRLIAVWFVVVVSAPLILFVMGARPAELENTTPAPAPELAMGSLLDTDMYAGITAWFEDRLPGRDRAIEADAWIDYNLFGDSPTPRVLLGSDGWLYLQEGVVAECLDTRRIAAAVDEIALIDRALALTGRDFLVLVAPNKAAIYPEHLGAHADDQRCAAANRAAVREMLAASDVTAVLDTWALLDDAKAAGGPQLYHRLDTHWNRLGASVAAAAVVDRVVPGLWDPTALVETGTGNRVGDLVKLMGLSFGEEAATWEVQRANTPGTERTKLKRGPEAVVSTVSEGEVVAADAVMLNDSMGEAVAPLLRPYWGTLTTIRVRGGPQSFGVEGVWFDQVLADADLLIAQTVERSFLGRFNGELARAVIGALAAELPGSDLAVTPGLVGPTTDTMWDDQAFELVTDGDDPKIRIDLPAPSGPGDYLVVRMTPARRTTAQLFWRTPGGSFSEEASARVAVRSDDTTVVFDLSGLGNATELRIDPGKGAGHRISTIRVVEISG